MVIYRWMQLFSLTLIFLSNSHCYSEESINSKKLLISIEKTKSILGRPIRVDLYGINLKTKISTVDLNSLNKDFGVVIDYSINNATDERWPNQKIQMLKFKLYPRKTGKIVVPKIKLDNIYSDKKVIYVSSGNTSQPKLSVQTANPYTRQQFIIYINITSSQPDSRLFISQTASIDGFGVLPLKFERRKTKEGRYNLKIGWAISAQRSGQQIIKLPPIEYSVSGVLRKKFYLPLTEITVKALPSYLPPTIPVGKISIQGAVSHKGILTSNSIAYWNLSIKGNLNNSYELPPILRQIKSNSQIDFLPVNTKRSTENSSNNIISTVHYSIPFKTLNSGVLKLPNIQLQYFDPASEKITELNYKTSYLLTLSYFWKLFITFILFFTFIFFIKLSHKYWKKHNSSKQKILLAMRILEKNNVESLKESIKLLIEAEYWPQNITIQQWGRYWENKYQANNAFNEFIGSLSSCFYAASNCCEINKLSLELLTIIKNKKPNKSANRKSFYLMKFYSFVKS